MSANDNNMFRGLSVNSTVFAGKDQPAKLTQIREVLVSLHGDTVDDIERLMDSAIERVLSVKKTLFLLPLQEILAIVEYEVLRLFQKRKKEVQARPQVAVGRGVMPGMGGRRAFPDTFNPSHPHPHHDDDEEEDEDEEECDDDEDENSMDLQRDRMARGTRAMFPGGRGVSRAFEGKGNKLDAGEEAQTAEDLRAARAARFKKTANIPPAPIIPLHAPSDTSVFQQPVNLVLPSEDQAAFERKAREKHMEEVKREKKQQQEEKRRLLQQIEKDKVLRAQGNGVLPKDRKYL